MLELQRMFLSNEREACVYSTKQDGQDIAQLMGHDQRLWSAVGEVCIISEPLVKVLWLVDGDKTAMDYLYEAMDKTKEAIYRCYEDKGGKDSPREIKFGVWLMGDGITLPILPFMQQGYSSTLHSLMLVDLILMVRSWMVFSSVLRGWCTLWLNA